MTFLELADMKLIIVNSNMSWLSFSLIKFFFTQVKKRDAPVAHDGEVFVFLSGCMHCQSFTKMLTLARSSKYDASSLEELSRFLQKHGILPRSLEKLYSF